MSRWCLRTVRALGGHDINSRLSHFPPQTSRHSRPQFIGVRAHEAVPVAGEIDSPVVASSSPLSKPVEQFESCGPACSRTSRSPIDILKRFLSPGSDYPFIYSSRAIRSLYYYAESRNQLGMLDSKMLTLLICLFGSLSIDSSISIPYRDSLAPRLSQVSTCRTHWAFVLKVGRYKLRRGMPLQDSDRFWLMRAELGTIQAGPPSELLSRDAYSAAVRARTHYHIIRRHSRCPEVHAHYLEVLLAIRDPRLIDIAARDLSFLLRTHRVCHRRLQRILHRLVVRYGGVLSIESREAILTALWSRSCRGTSGPSNIVAETGLSGTVAGDYAFDTISIARSLTATLFGFVELVDEKPVNLANQLLSVFSPAYTFSMRWNSLVLFSIFNSEVPQLTTTHLTSDHTIPQVALCWHVIFGLATIENDILQESLLALAMPASTEGILETTRTLHQLWLPVKNSWLVSRDLACAITASFLRVVCVLADAALFRDCQNLYHEENSLEGPRTSAQKLLAAQYIGAAMRLQGSLSDGVLRILEAFSLDSELQRQILALAVKALAPIDTSLAYVLYSVAQGKGVELGPEATYALAMSSVRRGAFHEAILFVNSGRFSAEKRGILISAIARKLQENPRTRYPPSALLAVVDELAVLYRSQVPPEHFRGHLEQLFVTLTRHGRGPQLFPVMLSIFKMSPDFFQPRFFLRYCHALIRHRQFPIASKLLDAITAVHPKLVRSLRILTDRGIMRTKAFRTTPLRGPTSLRLSSRLQRHLFAGPSLEISLQELLRSGRVLAAKRIFACAAATISSRRCTALGNILLHGVSRQPTSRNGRRVRKILALMENLVENHDFRPDRVTANILIKGMITWRSAFDSQRLRELFDQLVRSGYPAADCSPSHPPFSTQQTQPSGSSGFSKLLPFISFEKHGRPLFKMFTKAFYLCNDVEAARKVVGILKVEAYKNAMALELRRKARSKGRAKAGQRSAIPLDTVVSSID